MHIHKAGQERFAREMDCLRIFTGGERSASAYSLSHTITDQHRRVFDQLTADGIYHVIRTQQQLLALRRQCQSTDGQEAQKYRDSPRVFYRHVPFPFNGK
jgi:hypothetical protein